ncbi:HNH endonuclease [Micromonospora chalcea]|uniref:HNH endonuclease n=1 Tax=Micromonospora chalcea TaxID=1874 RepID=UPI003D71BCE9
MCGRVTPTTIDHFLPKDKYPEFSLFVNNLVPVCPDCNRYKSTLTGSQEEGRFFHAYYDDVPADVPLLISKISVGEGVLVTFSVNDALSGSLYKNAKYQFEKLRLGKLYPRAAVPELVERCDSFAAAFASGGSVAVAREARRIGRGIERKLGRQYWKVALYHGISVSQSFCNGGFGLLGGKSLASSRSVMEEAAAWRSWRAGP